MDSKIIVYSQNVSCDTLSERLCKSYGEQYAFNNRIEHLINKIDVENTDIIAFNEVRYDKNITQLSAILEQKGFIVKKFANNSSKMTFCNILSISKQSKWSIIKWEHVWVALSANDEPCLRSEHSLIEGDKHGRCAGVLYLKHQHTRQQICVMVSHVMPFDDVKFIQQRALLSLNKKNLNQNLPVPTIIAGDLNRFWNEEERFQEQLQAYNMIEAKPTQLVIPKSSGGQIIKTNEDIGTFMPWPTDEKIYGMKLYEPMSTSRLDVQLYTHSPNMITCQKVIAKASMMLEPNEDEPPKGINETRHMLSLKMASDHTAIIGTYLIHQEISR